MGAFDHLSTPEDRPRFNPQPKAASRTVEKAQQAGADARLLKAWQIKVFKADGYGCRKCGAKVVQTIERVPTQAHAHHVKGRAEKLARYDVRNGLTLCRLCHEQVTGAINEKWIILPTKMFTVARRVFTNAREKVTFKRVA